MKILDCHVHYALPISREHLASVLSETKTDMANLVVVPHRYKISSTPDALAYKHAHPDSTYVFTGLDASVYVRFPKRVGKKMARFARRMLSAGCDGIKLIEGKPSVRRTLPIPDFDSGVWEPFWAFAEGAGVPILWHVNDPEEFWDPDRLPEFARESGWGYGPEDINNEEQYRQVLAVLERHPGLRIIFAHMFFMSAQLPRLSELMRRFKNVCVDLTPGIELYVNLSADPKAAAVFFAEFQDRIMYGTDIGARAVIASAAETDARENSERVRICRTFLEHGGEFSAVPDGGFLLGDRPLSLRGLGLPCDILKKVCRDNFVRFAGGPPAPVKIRRTLSECRRLSVMMRMMTFAEKGFVPDKSALEDVRRYFKTAKRAK